MTRPLLLDLFCGAGGAAMGYHRAGFDVVGVDIKPQPHYPFDFERADVFEWMRDGVTDWYFPVHAIHASPPCQAFTDLKNMHNAKRHEDLLTPTRALLKQTGLPWVIENVEGAPMSPTVVLCGSSFGLGAEGARLQRHRLFETSFPMMAPPCVHGVAARVIGVYGGHGRDRRRTLNTQDYSTQARREAMGIDWMTGAELSQAIPPAYTEYIGAQLLEHIQHEVEVAGGME